MSEFFLLRWTEYFHFVYQRWLCQPPSQAGNRQGWHDPLVLCTSSLGDLCVSFCSIEKQKAKFNCYFKFIPPWARPAKLWRVLMGEKWTNLLVQMFPPLILSFVFPSPWRQTSPFPPPLSTFYYCLPLALLCASWLSLSIHVFPLDCLCNTCKVCCVVI